MNTKVLFLLFITLSICWISCKKENGDLPPVINKAGLYVINAGTDTLNIYQNGTRIDNTGSFFTGGALGYYPVTDGTQNYQLKKVGNPNAFISIPLTLDSARAYSLFIAGESTDKIFLTKDTLFIDSLNALVRVVNASPMAAKVDITIGGTSYKGSSFKSATTFKPVAPMAKTLNVYQSGTTVPLVPAKTITLTANVCYTVFTYGVINGTGNNTFGVKLVTNQ